MPPRECPWYTPARLSGSDRNSPSATAPAPPSSPTEAANPPGRFARSCSLALLGERDPESLHLPRRKIPRLKRIGVQGRVLSLQRLDLRTAQQQRHLRT